MLYLGGTYKKGGRLQGFSANLDDAGRIRLGHAYWCISACTSASSTKPRAAVCQSTGITPRSSTRRCAASWCARCLAYQRLLLDMSDIEAVVRKPEFKTRKALRRLWSRLRYLAF